MMAFSREIALSIVSCTSYQTRVCTWYRLVNPAAKSFLCSQTLRMRAEVTPTYNVPLRLGIHRARVLGSGLRRNDGVDASEVDLLAKGCLAYRLGLRLQEVVALKLRTPAVPVIPVKAGIHDTVGPASFQYTGLRRCDGKYSSYADSGN